MASGDLTPGRRADVDTAPHELEPGEFTRRPVLYPSGGCFDVWWFCTPNGLLGRLAMPEDVAAARVDRCHHVHEHADGLITVIPQAGNSNSIKCTGWPLDGGMRTKGEPLLSWHGYIEHGVWREV